MDRQMNERGDRLKDGEQPATADDRKLPVLFHLIDVSRPRPRPATVLPLDLASPPPAAARASGEPEFTLAPLDLPALSSLPVLPLLDNLPAIPHTSVIPAPPPTTLELPPEPPSNELPQPTADKPATKDVPAAMESSPPVAKWDKPVSLPSARQLNRRPKSTAHEDWFAAHGKFIAVAFVLALIGTVYFARSPRRPTPRQEDAVRPVAPLIELASVSEASPTKSIPAASAPPDAIASAPAPVKHTAATVELHMPAPPAAQVATANEKPIGNDNLFVFAAGKPGEERVPAQPVPGAVAQAPPAPAPLQPAATMSPAYPVTPSPSLYPSPAVAAYPHTTAPPLTANSTNTYQAMSPPAGPPLPAIPPAGNYGPAGPYQAPDNVARGPRYEHTGQGNY